MYNLIPVSYTHLDVYKRQAASCGIHSQEAALLSQRLLSLPHDAECTPYGTSAGN